MEVTVGFFLKNSSLRKRISKITCSLKCFLSLGTSQMLTLNIPGIISERETEAKGKEAEAKGKEAEAKVMTFRQKGNKRMQTCEKMHTKSREEKVGFLV